MQEKTAESKKTPEGKRKDALGEALRHNLRRRKQQKRERSETENISDASETAHQKDHLGD